MSQIATYAPSTGHSPWTGTLPISGMFDNFQIGGRRLILANQTVYIDHTASETTHTGRTPTTGISNFKFKGYSVCKVGSPISCGDTVGPNQIDTIFNIP